MALTERSGQSDLGEYERDASRDAACRRGSYFRERVTAEALRNRMEERLALLGALESRTQSSTQRLTTVPDAPPGDYFVFEFDGVYELRPNAEGGRPTATFGTKPATLDLVFVCFRRVSPATSFTWSKHGQILDRLRRSVSPKFQG